MRRIRFALFTVTILLVALKTFAQMVPAPQASSPDQPKGWLDKWREGTVSIGRLDEAEVVIDGVKSKKKIFVPIGTGLVVHEDKDRLWLVTAKHIFDDPALSWRPEKVQIRFSWFDEKSVDDYLGVTMPLQQDGKRLWTAHSNPEVDLACIPLVVSVSDVGRPTMMSAAPSDFAGPKDYYAGALVIVLGYPGAVGQNFWNRALARQGMIAWVAPIDPDKHPFLIDSNIFHGNSGGPVFRAPLNISELGVISGGTTSLLGIVSQIRAENLPVTVGGKTMQITLPQQATPGAEPEKTEPVLSPNLIGIGVIEPVSRILEVLRSAGASIMSK